MNKFDFVRKCCLKLNQNYSDYHIYENLNLNLKRIFKIVEKELEYFSKNK